MRRGRTLWLITLCALLLGSVAPHARASWQCDGRVCSTSLLYCCCEGPAGERDASCGRTTQLDSAAGACGSDCSCVLTVEVHHAACPQNAPSLLAAPFHPVLLPAAPEVGVPLPTGIAARFVELRGPPVRRPQLASPSLRAPPAA